MSHVAAERRQQHRQEEEQRHVATQTNTHIHTHTLIDVRIISIHTSFQLCHIPLLGHAPTHGVCTARWVGTQPASGGSVSWLIPGSDGTSRLPVVRLRS